jgi:hypothetical protein
MAYRCRLLLGWMAKGCVAASKPMIGLIGGVVGMVQAVGPPAVVVVVVVVVDTMALGVRQDSGVVGVEWPRWSPQGRTLLSDSSSALTLAIIYFFLSRCTLCKRRQMKSPPHPKLKGVVCKMGND